MLQRFLPFAILTLLFAIAPRAVFAQEHETHVTLGHDLHAELSEKLTLPSGLTLSVRVGAQDGSHANIDFAGAGCVIDGEACTAEDVAAAAIALKDNTLVSVGGGVGYQATVDDNDVNLSATGTWVSGEFTPGLDLRVTRDNFWVGYLAWHHDLSGAISKSISEYDLELGRAGVVRIGIGIKF